MCGMCALMNDGTVLNWGQVGIDGFTAANNADLYGVESVVATNCAFAALKTDGSVVVWGHFGYGNSLSTTLNNVKSITAGGSAFAALRNDGSVVTWGKQDSGGNSDGVDFSGGVKRIVQSHSGFAAIKNDDSVVTWGFRGGDSSMVNFTGGVENIWGASGGFAGLKKDGSVIAWGAELFDVHTNNIQFNGTVLSISRCSKAFVATVLQPTATTPTLSPTTTPTSLTSNKIWQWACDCNLQTQSYEECYQDCVDARGNWAWTCNSDSGLQIRPYNDKIWDSLRNLCTF